MSDRIDRYVVDFTVRMATQKYGKVRIGQLIGSLLGVWFPTPAKSISHRSWGDLSLADPGAVTIRHQRLGILTACLKPPAALVKCQKTEYDSYSW
jgi:hypothetical protein